MKFEGATYSFTETEATTQSMVQTVLDVIANKLIHQRVLNHWCYFRLCFGK